MVRVTERRTIEEYASVYHSVAQVEGRLHDGLDLVDLLKATFPGGSITGAPKVRAMEIIEELEPVRRGPYAGAVGYFGFNGSLDSCITIRTIIVQDKTAFVQVGAGIVADSVPAREYRECLQKAWALFQAVKMAEGGLQ